MATDTRNLPAFCNTDAEFRTWGSGVAAALQACGLVKTSDTGQIDWATVTRPAGTTTAAGYEIYRFNDALQATKPVVIKVEYGNANSVGAPSLWITVGSTTNGAGTITGVAITTRRQTAFTGQAVGTVWTAYTSGGDGRIAFYFGNGALYFMGFIIERAKTEAGVLVGEMVYALVFNGLSTWGAAILQLGVNVINGTYGNAMPIATISGWSNSGSNVCVSPHILAFGHWLYAFVLTYVTVDLTPMTTFQMDYLGATHTFLPLNQNHAYTNAVAQGGHSLAMLWE